MKWIILTLVLVPLLSSGQAFLEHGAIAWHEIMILRQPNSHSVFHPKLTEMAASPTDKQWLVAGSNPFMIKGLTRLDVHGYQNLEHAAWGLSTHLQGGGPVSSISLSIDYSQMISSHLAVGLKIQGSANQWQGYAPQKSGGITGKLLYRISPNTAWTSSIRLDKSGTKGFGSIRKSWTTGIGHTLSKELFIAIQLEKEDDRDPVLQMLLDWKLDTRFGLQGGINIASGNMMLGGYHDGNHHRKGLIFSHHPLLGYGLEIFFCHGWN